MYTKEGSRIYEPLLERASAGRGMILLGHCCSRKSTTAHQLFQIARNTGLLSARKVELWDSDNELLKYARARGYRAQAISDLFIEMGETEFRLLETHLILQHLSSCLASKAKSSFSIMALGGGSLVYINQFATGVWEKLSGDYIKIVFERSSDRSYGDLQKRWRTTKTRSYLAKPMPSLALWSFMHQRRFALACIKADLALAV